MSVPLPTADEVLLVPPSLPEVREIMGGVAGAISPPAGLTDLQRMLVHAVTKSMTSFDLTVEELDPLGPHETALALRRRNREFRSRIVQVMLLGALILVPLPVEVEQRIEEYARELSVDDGMLRVARDYAHGSLGLAIIDFDRSGYTADWHPERASAVHTSSALEVAWQECVSDRALADRWAALEHCPPGSLGRGVFDFYRARGFVFPGNPGSAPPFLAQHDWVHVLADYGSTVESEIEVFGLIARAIPDPRGFSLLAMVIGLFETGYVASGAGLFQMDRGHLSRDSGMATRLADAMRRGALCGRDLLAIDWFSHADQPLPDARAELGVVHKAPEAVVAGSVGPWQPGGISAFQWSAGVALAEAEGRRYDPAGAELLPDPAS